MKKTIVMAVMVILSLCGTTVFADNGEIDPIRKKYTSTKNRIKKNALYRDQFVINKSGMTWPAVGNYGKTIDIYYTLCDELKEHNYPNERCIYMITVSEKASVSTAKTEFLFDDKDGLIFIYYRNDYDRTEKRYYLSSGKLIRYCENDAVYDKDIEAHCNKTIFDNLAHLAQKWAFFLKVR